MMTKKDSYFILVLLIVFVFFILNFFISSSKKEMKIEWRKEEIVPNFSLKIFSLMYLTMFFVGLAKVINFTIKKIKNRKIVSHFPQKLSILPFQKTKLLFFVLFFIFIILSLQEIFYFFKRTDHFLFAILINLILELGIIAIILKYYPLNLSKFDFKIKPFYLVHLYLIIFPFIVSTLFLNGLILEKLGIKPTVNPAIGLIFTLKNKFLLFLLSLQIVIIGPIAEELLFRRFIYRWLREKFSFLISTLLVSFGFSLLHQNIFYLPSLFIVSISLCYLYEKTKNILNPIILHSLHNSLNLLFAFMLRETLF
jgi:hypothetical protein